MRENQCQFLSRPAGFKASRSRPLPRRRYYVVLGGMPAELVVRPWDHGYEERRKLAASAGLLLSPDAAAPFERHAVLLAGGSLYD